MLLEKLNSKKNDFFSPYVILFCNFAGVKTNELSNQLKQKKMKKALFLLAVASIFAACAPKSTETPTATATETPVQTVTPTASATETPAQTPAK
jgi:hypothetical protein